VDWLEESGDEFALLEIVEVLVDEDTLGDLEDEPELVDVAEVAVGDEAGEAVVDDERIMLLIEELIVLFIANVTELRNTPL
jgi:hypothetical protein